MLLVAFGALAYCVLLLPVWAMGYPYEVPNIAALQAVIDGGDVNAYAPSRLMPWLVAPFELSLSTGDVISWVELNALALVLSIFPLWWCVYRLFDKRVAWASIIIFVFMPVQWIQALRMDGYAFAYIFFFSALALFEEAQKRKGIRQVLFILLAGVAYGFTLAARDAFILFLPGIVTAAMYFGRAHIKQTSMYIATFLLAGFIAYSLPLMHQVWSADVSFSEKLVMFVGAQRGKPSLSHFYPDPYTYEFDREGYIERARDHVATLSWLERKGAENYMQVFGAHDRTIFSTLVEGSWLLAGSVPILFTQDYVGGMFLWLFILPGILFLYRSNRKVCIILVWLVVSLEVVTRYIFFAQRVHSMDYGWVLAIFAAVGVFTLAKKLQIGQRLTAVVILCIVLQFAQAQRAQIARFYNKSHAPKVYAAAVVLDQLPADAVVAHPAEIEDHFYLTRVNHIVFAPETIARLDAKELREAFSYYGVTHTFGYKDPPSVAAVVTYPDSTKKVGAPSKLVELFIHLFR